MKKIKQLLHGEDKNDIKSKETNEINKDVIDYLIKNAYLQNKIEFYMSLDVKVIQHLITASFKQRSMDHENKIFVINLLKKHTFILNIAFTNDKFDYTDLFSFLNLPNITYDLLNAFEDIFIPYCKKFPQKFLNLLAKNMDVKQTFMGKIYTKQIFKILYTAVFCCDQAHFAEVQQISSEIMNKLIDSIFMYSPNSEIISKPSQNLQYGQVSSNLKDFLSDLTTNLDSVDLILVDRFITRINSEIIKKIVTYFGTFRANYQYEDYCQGIIIVFINILKLLESFKLSVNSKSHEKQKDLKIKIESTLCACAVDITSYLPTYVEFICENNTKTLNYSSGQKIQRVGLLKYRVLQLIQKILSINQIQSLKIPFEQFDFFPVIITFMQRYKWNSIAHNLIVKITQHILSQDYKNFKLRYLQGVIHANKSLFGQFIIHFRNRKFIFLHSMRMINQGHRSLIFRISQLLILEMQERNDLNLLIDMFKIWKQYMQIDLLEYEEKNYQISLYFNDKREEQSKKYRNTDTNDLSMSSMEENSSKSLEKIQQILLKFREQEKWSPIQKSKMRKQNIMDHQQIKKIDSMAFYLPHAS